MTAIEPAGPAEARDPDRPARLLRSEHDAVAAECSLALSRSRHDGGGPGLIRVCGAGFLFQHGVPGREAGSYRRSAGIYPVRPTIPKSSAELKD